MKVVISAVFTFSLSFVTTASMSAVQPTPVISRVLLADAQVRIADVVGFGSKFVFGSTNGVVTATTVDDDSVLWEHKLPYSAHIVRLNSIEGAVTVLSADGSLYMINEDGYTQVNRDGPSVVQTCKTPNHIGLLCLTATDVSMMTQQSPLEHLYNLPVCDGYPSSLYQYPNGMILLGTSTGWLYRLNPENGQLIKVDSSKIDPLPRSVESITEFGNTVFASTFTESFYIDSFYNHIGSRCLHWPHSLEFRIALAIKLTDRRMN